MSKVEMGRTIRDYGSYKGVPISRDYNVVDGEQVYIGNGQGCSTLWFKSVPETKRFIDYYKDRITVTDLGCVTGLIPHKICQDCQGHYSFGSQEWRRATRDNCRDVKEILKAKADGKEFDIDKALDEISVNGGDITKLKVPKCPACGVSGKDFLIGYTEHGTMAFDGKQWLQSEQGADAEYYCLSCDCKLDYEELEKLGVF